MNQSELLFCVLKEVRIMNNDEYYMRLALQEAHKGRFHTWKNPQVGAVIVKDDQVLAKGCHRQYGGFHAERAAISQLTSEQLLNSTLYVTLEPCAHYGKQPPCDELVANSGIKRVVIAQTDPHQLVHGKGIAVLKKHGLAVTTGVLADEAAELNSHYSYFYSHNRPWLTVKQAISLDGKVAAKINQRTVITNAEVYARVHQERADFHAIVIGSATALIDNPSLLTSQKQSHPPVRVVLDRRGRLLDHLGLQLLTDGQAPTWVITENKELAAHCFDGDVTCFLSAGNDLQTLFDLMTQNELQSVYVEGGPTLVKSILDNYPVNELITYLDPRLLGRQAVPAAVAAKSHSFAYVSYEQLGQDLRIEERHEYV